MRQLERQVGSQSCERTALSKSKTAMLTEDGVRVTRHSEAEITDPLVLEFLDLRDEHSREAGQLRVGCVQSPDCIFPGGSQFCVTGIVSESKKLVNVHWLTGSANPLRVEYLGALVAQ